MLPGDDRRRRRRVDERAGGRSDVHGRVGAARRGEVRLGEAADDEVAGRAGHGERAVEVSLVLRRRAGEVDLDLVTGDRDGDVDLQRAVERARARRAPRSVRRGAWRSQRAPRAPSSGRARPSPPSTVSAPRRSTSSASRRSASRCAASCASRSPRRSSGLRMFASSTVSSSSSSRTGGSTRPSW